MTSVPYRVTILTPDGETALPKQASSVSESALRTAGSLQTLSVALAADEMPKELLDPTVARNCEIVATYYLTGRETRTYSGAVEQVERRGSHYLVTFRTDR